ncbi:MULTISPECIES: hypothetical protein [unclassified Tolypothrix]|nr:MULTISPECIES: hypothetical protein [unclassified Tolypothrix]EKF03622.1 hypothetical protein FDUTEX481_02319 [Tolypothrix sp. PCC 7601]BAY94054.1 hypothetical protein NIES3275_60990 [Microchaete diplosiphon NIES-3275]
MDLHYEIQGKGDAIALIHSGGADLRDTHPAEVTNLISDFLSE